MTNREAMQQALEALIDAANVLSAPMFADAADALRKALAQPEQEPVAFYHPRNGFYWAKPTSIFAPTSVDVERLPLYTNPAQREWQGLTDEDKQTAVWTDGTFGGGALWAQQLLKERNNG